MKVALIIGTRDRAALLDQMLHSIADDRLFLGRIVIVDQSDGVETEAVAQAHAAALPIEYVRDRGRGLSRARNIGILRLRGDEFDIIAFPDDDCRYLPDTLTQVIARFASDEALAIVTGQSVGDHGAPTQGRWATQITLLNRYNIWTCQTSYTTFYRYKFFQRLGGFDETLGVGAGTKWGAGEETEFMLRALKRGAKGLYDPSIKLVHPEPLAVINSQALARGTSYNRGFGRVMKLAKFPLGFIFYMLARPFAGSLVSLLKGDLPHAHYRWIAARERFLGWRDV